LHASRRAKRIKTNFNNRQRYEKRNRIKDIRWAGATMALPQKF
jgi:hypothetical protein